MKAILASLWQDESGQAAVEYGLILGLVAVAIVTALTLLGTNLTTTIQTVATILP